MVSSSSSLWSANSSLLLQQQPCSSFSNYRHSATPSRWGFRKEFDLGRGIRRTKDEAFRVANPNVTIASGRERKEVIMVDPVEAKRLAAKQMESIKAKQSFQRRRQIEAINGAWAMLGLTAGLVLEGQTGNGILAQVVKDAYERVRSLLKKHDKSLQALANALLEYETLNAQDIKWILVPYEDGQGVIADQELQQEEGELVLA